MDKLKPQNIDLMSLSKKSQNDYFSNFLCNEFNDLKKSNSKTWGFSTGSMEWFKRTTLMAYANWQIER